jgi:hypothetical protein
MSCKSPFVIALSCAEEQTLFENTAKYTVHVGMIRLHEIHTLTNLGRRTPFPVKLFSTQEKWAENSVPQAR